MFRGAALVGAGLAFPRAADSAAGEETSEAHSRIKKGRCGWLAMERRDWNRGILAQAFLEAGDDDERHSAHQGRDCAARPRWTIGTVVIEGGTTDPAMGGGGLLARAGDG